MGLGATLMGALGILGFVTPAQELLWDSWVWSMAVHFQSLIVGAPTLHS